MREKVGSKVSIDKVHGTMMLIRHRVIIFIRLFIFLCLNTVRFSMLPRKVAHQAYIKAYKGFIVC